MQLKVDLHLRHGQAQDHRHIGAVTIQHEGPELAPHDSISWQTGHRQVLAQVTSLHQRGGHLPEVYADEVLH